MVDEVNDQDSPAPRQHRPGVERGSPDRRYGGGEKPPEARAATPGDVPEVVAHAVRLGYRVVEENLRQGRDAADKIKAHNYDAGDASADVERVLRRFIGLAQDLSGSFFDLIAALLADERLRDAVAAGRGGSHGAPKKAEPPASTPVQIIGYRGASGEAHLGSLAGLEGPPLVSTLRPLSAPPDAPPIAGARLGADSETGGLVVIVPVPEEQPPGSYNGTIHDSSGVKLLGSVLVNVPKP